MCFFVWCLQLWNRVCDGLACAEGNHTKLRLHLVVKSFILRVCSDLQLQVKYCEEATCRNSVVSWKNKTTITTPTNKTTQNLTKKTLTKPPYLLSSPPPPPSFQDWRSISFKTRPPNPWDFLPPPCSFHHVSCTRIKKTSAQLCVHLDMSLQFCPLIYFSKINGLTCSTDLDVKYEWGAWRSVYPSMLMFRKTYLCVEWTGTELDHTEVYEYCLEIGTFLIWSCIGCKKANIDCL